MQKKVSTGNKINNVLVAVEALVLSVPTSSNIAVGLLAVV